MRRDGVTIVRREDGDAVHKSGILGGINGHLIGGGRLRLIFPEENFFITICFKKYL